MITLEEKNLDLIHDYLSKGWGYYRNGDVFVFKSPDGLREVIYLADGECFED